MIRIYTVFSLLNKIPLTDRQWLEKDSASFRGTVERCPHCGANGCLKEFGHYGRYLIELESGEAGVRPVEIKRYRCTSCSHTHALLSSCLVPYRSYSLRFILTVLYSYFGKHKTVEQISTVFGMAVSTLYEWKKLFMSVITPEAEREIHRLKTLRQCRKNVEDGYVYVVDMDLEKFFDTLSRSKLIEVLSRAIKDGRVIPLIHKYLNAGVPVNGLFEKTETGMPQGGPLSPLLSNVMLNELDKELERRGHRFARYADDCMIFCKSRKSAERTLENIVPFIEGKLFLKVNRKKTKVAHISKAKYPGCAFYRYNGKCRFRVHPKSVVKMRNKIRELTDRNNGMSNTEREEKYGQYVKGWINYYKLADMKGLLRETDEWARRRIRAVYWKQWKKIRTKYRMLKALGFERWKATELANSRKGIWRMAQVLNQIFSNKIIARPEYTSILDYYLKVCEN